MTNLESLKMQLQYAVEKHGENARSAQELRRQLGEIEQSRLAAQALYLQQFQAGFRKAKAAK